MRREAACVYVPAVKHKFLMRGALQEFTHLDMSFDKLNL